MAEEQTQMVREVMSLAGNGDDLALGEKLDRDLGIVAGLWGTATCMRNLAMWAAGKVYVAMKEDPSSYGLKSEEEVPSQQEFGQQYMGGASHTTVQRAAQIYRAYDPQWIYKLKHVTQSHLLTAADLPDENRTGVLENVDGGIASGNISTTEGATMIQELKEPEQKPEEWPPPADKEDHGEDEDQTGQGSDTRDDIETESPVEAPSPEPQGGPGEVTARGTDSAPARDVGNAQGSITKAQLAAGRAYREIRAFSDNLGAGNLTKRQKDLLDAFDDTLKDMDNVVQSLRALG